jgi:predicted nicotinamide N-methyase
MFSMDSFQSFYDPEIIAVPVGSRTFRVCVPSRIEDFIDPLDPLRAFPLWVKIWPAAYVLAELLAATASDAGQQMIEVGGGLGLVSVVAASAGHRISFSEADPNALQFARANALLNGLPQLPVLHLDWNSPSCAERFDVILGSELIYRRHDITPLLALFARLLAPGGHILLAGEDRQSTCEFLIRSATAYRVERVGTVRCPSLRSANAVQVLRLEPIG